MLRSRQQFGQCHTLYQIRSCQVVLPPRNLFPYRQVGWGFGIDLGFGFGLCGVDEINYLGSYCLELV